MVNATYRKYIDKELVKKIEKVQEDYQKKGKSCSFIKASKLLAKRI